MCLLNQIAIVLHVINSCGRTRITSRPRVLCLASLVPRDMLVSQGRLPFTVDGYVDSRLHGLRKRINNLDASLDEPSAHVYNSVLPNSVRDA